MTGKLAQVAREKRDRAKERWLWITAMREIPTLDLPLEVHLINLERKVARDVQGPLDNVPPKTTTHLPVFREGR